MIWKIKFVIVLELSENVKSIYFDRWSKGLLAGFEPKVESYYEHIISFKVLIIWFILSTHLLV